MPTYGRRRAYGQHFLKDRSISDRIAEVAVTSARENSCLSLLEIGPGKGAITLPILDRLQDQPLPSGDALEFIICEKDRTFAEHWLEFPPGNARVRVESADFLELDEQKWLARPPVGVVSNLPYSSGTAILQRLARHYEKIPVMVLMFQAEVAKRLRAEPDSDSWGSLSIWIQNRWDVKRLLSVPPGAFAPPPDVDSEVVTLVRREKPRIEVVPELEVDWEKLLKTSFAHRRKMLRSGLPRGSRWQIALAASGLDDTKRAEALTWDEWERFFQALQRL